MKLSLRQKMRIANGLLAATVVLLFMGMAFGDRGLFQGGILIKGAIGALLVGLPLNLAWWKCPHCKTYLGRTSYPTYCPHCGEKIDYDAK